MTAASYIKEHLANVPAGQPFPARSLRRFASTENIRQVLSRLTRAGELKRVARGIFVKPEHISKIGEVLPSIEEIAQTLAKSTGEVIAMHGAEAARQLHLTTQVPMRLVFYTNGHSRTLKIANRTVMLQHVNPSRLVAPGTVSSLVISALHYLGRKQVTIQTIATIKRRISPKEFEENLALTERMPAWMSDIFYRYQESNK